MDLDRLGTTSFERALHDPSGTRFVYRVRTGINYPLDDARAEVVRMQWLDRWLEVNKLCPKGRVIERRDVMKVGGVAVGAVAHITYVISCL